MKHVNQGNTRSIRQIAISKKNDLIATTSSDCRVRVFLSNGIDDNESGVEIGDIFTFADLVNKVRLLY